MNSKTKECGKTRIILPPWNNYYEIILFYFLNMSNPSLVGIYRYRLSSYFHTKAHYKQDIFLTMVALLLPKQFMNAFD